MSTARVQLVSELVPLAGGAVAEPRSLDFSERLQREHYDEIAAEYEAHYSDASSLDYRRQFIYRPMFQGLNLRGMTVLDAMCGSGQTTEYLLKNQG